MPFDFGYPNSSAEQRGWGLGWEPGKPIGDRPDSYSGKIVTLSVDLTSYGQKVITFEGGVREEVHDLLAMLLEECGARGYKYTDPGCWGGAFRPTKRSDGSFTTTPSNHSWYVAIDVSAPKNVYGKTTEPTHDIPDWMVGLFRKYGWRWLGDTPIHDWQHFDFAGTPKDAREMTEKALADGLGGGLSDEQRVLLDEAGVFLDELRSAMGSSKDASKSASAMGAGTRVAKTVLDIEPSS